MRARWWVVGLALCVATESQARSNGIPNRANGCSGCHGTASSQVEGTLQGPTTVSAGETVTYTLTISSSISAHTAAGFSLQAFGGVLTAGSGTRVVGNSLTHTSPRALSGGTTSWTFSWTAPAQGTIAFSAAVLGVDGLAGSNSGDRWDAVPGLLVSVQPPVAPPDTDDTDDTDLVADTDGAADTDVPTDTDGAADPDTGDSDGTSTPGEPADPADPADTADTGNTVDTGAPQDTGVDGTDPTGEDADPVDDAGRGCQQGTGPVGLGLALGALLATRRRRRG